MGVFRRLHMRAEEGLQRDGEADHQHQAVADDGDQCEEHGAQVAVGERIVDLLLGEEAEEERQAAHGECGQKRCAEGDRHDGTEAAELRHLAGAGFMVDEARHHEERALEERMGHEIEHRRFDGMRRAEAGQHDEQAERGHGRIGEHQLQVGLADGQKRAGDQRHATEERQQDFPGGCRAHHRVQPHQQVDAGLHHGGGMQVGGDRGRRFHGVGKPEVEGELRRLGEGAAEQQNKGRQVEGAFAQAVADVDEERELRDAGHVPQEDQAGKQRQAAKPGDHQRLQGRAAGRLALVIEADQQEGGDRGELPVDEEHQEAVGDDEAEHGAHEQQDEAEEASELRVALHIAAGIEHDQRADAGDQQREGERQAVEEPGEGKVEARHPGKAAGDHAAVGHLRQEGQEMQEGQERRQCQKPASGMAESADDRRRKDCCQER